MLSCDFALSFGSWLTEGEGLYSLPIVSGGTGGSSMGSFRGCDLPTGAHPPWTAISAMVFVATSIRMATTSHSVANTANANQADCFMMDLRKFVIHT
jgi:hypothetical protein